MGMYLNPTSLLNVLCPVVYGNGCEHISYLHLGAHMINYITHFGASKEVNKYQR